MRGRHVINPNDPMRLLGRLEEGLEEGAHISYTANVCENILIFFNEILRRT